MKESVLPEGSFSAVKCDTAATMKLLFALTLLALTGSALGTINCWFGDCTVDGCPNFQQCDTDTNDFCYASVGISTPVTLVAKEKGGTTVANAALLALYKEKYYLAPQFGCAEDTAKKFKHHGVVSLQVGTAATSCDTAEVEAVTAALADIVLPGFTAGALSLEKLTGSIRVTTCGTALCNTPETILCTTCKKGTCNSAGTCGPITDCKGTHCYMAHITNAGTLTSSTPANLITAAATKIDELTGNTYLGCLTHYDRATVNEAFSINVAGDNYKNTCKETAVTSYFVKNTTTGANGNVAISGNKIGLMRCNDPPTDNCNLYATIQSKICPTSGAPSKIKCVEGTCPPTGCGNTTLKECEAYSCFGAHIDSIGKASGANAAETAKAEAAVAKLRGTFHFGCLKTDQQISFEGFTINALDDKYKDCVKSSPPFTASVDGKPYTVASKFVSAFKCTTANCNDYKTKKCADAAAPTTTRGTTKATTTKVTTPKPTTTTSGANTLAVSAVLLAALTRL